MDELKDKNGSSPNAYSLHSEENPQSQAFGGSQVMEQTDEDGHLISTSVDPSNLHTSERIVSVPSEMLGESDIAFVDDFKAVFPEVHDTPASINVHASRVIDTDVPHSGGSNTNLFVDAQTSNDGSSIDEEIEFKDHDIQHIEKTEVGQTQHTALKVSEDSEKAILNRRLIDTAAPFESVKAAVNKFGGTVDWKSQKPTTLEKKRSSELDLEITQEEIKKQYEDAEFLKKQVLEELHSTNRLVEELKLNLEKAETEAVEAKQDAELAELRVKEMEQGIDNNVSVAAKTQLEVAKERHQNAVAELISVRQELEELQKDYILIVDGRDIATTKAQESVSALKEIEKTVEDLTLDLITTKSLLESSQSAHLEEEEQKIGSVLAWEQDKVNWDNELKLAQEELQHHNEQLLLAADLKSKLEEANTLLASLKSELAIHKEAATSIDCTNTEEGSVPFELATTRRELIEVKSNIDKVKDELNGLRNIAHSLQSELEMEQTSLTTLRQKEALANVSISSLQSEINRTTTELELVSTKEKEAAEKKAELPKTLQLAAEEADQAKSLVLLAHEELKKAKTEEEQLKAGLSTMENRLDAALKEIKAVKMSEKLAISTLNALKESGSEIKEPEDSPRRVTLPVEDYYALLKEAHEAEESANNKVLCAYEKIKVIKASKLRSIERLEEANMEMEEKMKVLQYAIEKADEAIESKQVVEEELRKWRAEHEQLRKECDNFDEYEIDDDNISDTASDLIDCSPTSSTSSKFLKGKGSESRFRKRSFLPRILMFLARKKAQSYK